MLPLKPGVLRLSNIILLNKPFQVLCQFTDRDSTVATPRTTLARYLSAPGYRVAGRLDYDSEGLVVLTNNGRLQQHIANPRHKQWKVYWVQVEGTATQTAIQRLTDGVMLNDGPTLPARVRTMTPPPLWDRHPPVRYRATVPDSWLEIALQEGRNRQIRRMTAAVGLPTLRLVRVSVGPWHLGDLAPGCYRTEQHSHQGAFPKRGRTAR